MDKFFDRGDQHFNLPEVATVPLTRCFAWLGAGWHDMRANPLASLSHGLAIAILFALVLGYASEYPYLLAASVSGFLLIAPLLALGLYEISRRRAEGVSITFRESLAGWRRNASSIGLFGVVLALVAIAWERLSAILFALLSGDNVPDLGHFVREVVLSGHYDRLLLTYWLSGAGLAALVFAISAVSLPMMMDRDTDTVTAMMTSVKAVGANPIALGLWAMTIVVLTLVGFATFLIGTIAIMPLLGHATWHAYKELIR
jgi:uncharacterized membrane protein